MASSTQFCESDPSLCIVCLKLTKYSRISCPNIVCTMCSVFEQDEDTEGCVAGKSVAYCRFCYEERAEIGKPVYNHAPNEKPTSPVVPRGTKKR